MADDSLLDILLRRLDADTKLSEVAKGIVLAAYDSEDELAQAVDGTPTPVSAVPAPEDQAEPVGAYLTSITVAAFRGIGPSVTLPLRPGPGLTVVAGRNGSGKSSFAEAAEIALTGKNQRWDAPGRSVDWQAAWHNLHEHDGAQIEVGLLIEGDQQARAVVRRQWNGDDLADGVGEVARHGRSAEPLASLGWEKGLTTYRPFLSYNELGDALTGPKAELYDALYSILGLARIAQTHERLKAVLKRLTESERHAKTAAAELAQKADEVDDPRAADLARLLRARIWDLDTLDTLAALAAPVDDTDSQVQLLAGLAAIRPPDLDALTSVAQGLRTAAEQAAALRGTNTQRAQLDADLLRQALTRHTDTGDGPCPVCATGYLDDTWHTQARLRVDELQTLAAQATSALTAEKEARRRAQQLITPPPAVLRQVKQAGLVLPDDPADAWDRLRDAPEDLLGLAAHLEDAGLRLSVAVGALVDAAAAEREARQNRWAPLVTQLGAWLQVAQPVTRRRPMLADVKAATAWIKDATTDLANDRLAPVAAQSERIWEQLRQESNVVLGPVRLEGSATRRQVHLEVTVDDSPTAAALGVMSQGELHALALSLFLPRATAPDSPFRFLVIDDPVQAMDPAKVDGLAQVLASVAATRQVVVFTHDDRLPAAVRRLSLDATVLEVTRSARSHVSVTTSSTPADRHLRDAEALLRDAAVPNDVAATVVPGLCRLALDAACVEVIRRNRLERGATHTEVEALIAGSPKLYPRMALALFDDVDRDRAGDVLTRLNQWGSWAATTFRDCNAGAHKGASGDLSSMVRRTRQLIGHVDGRAERQAVPR